MRRCALIALVFLFCFLLCGGIAAAQIPTSGNVFFGYSFENASSSALNLNGLSRPNLQGWEATLEGKLFPLLGIVADFSGHYGSENATALTPNGPVLSSVTGHETEVMFGPRLGISVAKFRPFAEFEVGVGHMNTNSLGTDTSLAYAFGGGLDYKIIRPIAVRVQGDYVSTRFFGTTQQNLRISTGVVVRF
jgi:opacity protein-like surface antigen